MIGSTHRERATGTITAGEDVFGEGASRGMKRTQAGIYSAGFAFAPLFLGCGLRAFGWLASARRR